MVNYSQQRIIFGFVIIVMIGLLFNPTTSSALTLSPVRMEINGNPGETITKDILLSNESEGNITYYSSFSNFVASGDSGNPSFVDAENDIGSWMKTEDSVTLKPNETKTVTVSINIPNDADPGGHFGAIFWGTTPNNPGTSSVSIGARSGVLILLSVSGDVKESAGLVDFVLKDKKVFYNTLPVSFSYRFKNDGGDRIKPVGKITMHDILYIPEDKIDANPSQGNILPGSTRRFDVTWIKNPRSKDYIEPTGTFPKFFDQALYQWNNYAFGPYFAKLNILYGSSASRATDTVLFFVFPWQLLLCLALILLILWWGGRKLLRRYNRYIIRKASIGKSLPNTANHG